MVNANGRPTGDRRYVYSTRRDGEITITVQPDGRWLVAPETDAPETVVQTSIAGLFGLAPRRSAIARLWVTRAANGALLRISQHEAIGAGAVQSIAEAYCLL